jgi:hypothetical protein
MTAAIGMRAWRAGVAKALERQNAALAQAEPVPS